MPRPSLRVFWRRTDGGVVIEFALVAMVFFLIFFGIEEVARYVASKQDLMTAVHAAGRYAIVHGSNSSAPASAITLQQYVQTKLLIVPSSRVTTTVSFSPSNAPGGTVTVSSTYTWSPIVHIPVFGSANLSAQSVTTILN